MNRHLSTEIYGCIQQEKSYEDYITNKIIPYMSPEGEYLKIVSNLLREIKLKSLGLPKNPPPPQHVGFGNYRSKPHGVEFWIQPQTNYTLLRNIVYKLQEENYIQVVDETRGDGLDGTRFIVSLKPSFEDIYNLHEKGVKITKRLEDENYWVHANFQNNEIHFFIGLKNDPDGDHVHLIMGTTGEVRIDKNDKNPADLLKQVLAVTTKEGRTIKAELRFE